MKLNHARIIIGRPDVVEALETIAAAEAAETEALVEDAPEPDAEDTDND